MFLNKNEDEVRAQIKDTFKKGSSHDNSDAEEQLKRMLTSMKDTHTLDTNYQGFHRIFECYFDYPKEMRLDFFEKYYPNK